MVTWSLWAAELWSSGRPLGLLLCDVLRCVSGMWPPADLAAWVCPLMSKGLINLSTFGWVDK